VPEDVLQHDDGVVHDQADRQREAGEAHRVQREAAQVDQREGRDDRDRDRERDDQGGADVAEEEEQDDHGERAADQGVLLDPVHAVLDEAGLVVGEAERQLRVLLLRQLDLLADRLGGGDGVRAALPLDQQADRGLAVQAGGDAPLRGGVADGGDLAERDEPAAVGADRDCPHIVDAGEVAGGADRVLGLGLLGDAGRQVQVLLRDAVGDLLERQPAGAQLLRVHVQDDRALLAAGDVHRGDAVRALDDRRDLVVEQGAEPDRVLDARHAVDHDRGLGRVVLEDDGVLQRRVGREVAAGALDLLENVHGRLPDVHPPVELDADVGDALIRGGLYLVQAGHRRDGALDRAGDLRLNLLRGDVGPLGRDGDGRERDVGQQVHREAGVADGAEQDQRRDTHGHRDRARDREAGDVHRRACPSVAAPALGPPSPPRPPSPKLPA
jgi:hypothetical protein